MLWILLSLDSYRTCLLKILINWMPRLVYWLPTFSFCLSFGCFRRRQQQSNQQAKHGIRLWSLTVITQSLRTSLSGWGRHNNLVFALEIPADSVCISLVLTCYFFFCLELWMRMGRRKIGRMDCPQCSFFFVACI